MYCASCGNFMNDDDLFCVRCGTKVGTVAQVKIEGEEQPANQVQQSTMNTTPVQQPNAQYAQPTPVQQPNVQYTQPTYVQQPNVQYAQPQYQAYTVQRRTTGGCKVMSILLAIFSIFLCILPWATLNYFVSSKEMSIFKLIDYYDYSDGDDFTAICLLIGFLGAVIGIIGNVVNVFMVAAETRGCKRNVVGTGVMTLIGSGSACLILLMLASDSYSILEPTFVPFILFLISIIQLAISSGIHYGQNQQVMSPVYGYSYMSGMALSNEQLKVQGKWRCAFCGKINANYVGSCGCGHVRGEKAKDSDGV